jgi:transcriptional regulator with XRE-family HTH domain
VASNASLVEHPLPKRLRAARERAGLSQAKLGTLAGMDPSVASERMNQYERGVHEPKFSVVVALAAVLEVPTAYFYCLEDDLAEELYSQTR